MKYSVVYGGPALALIGALCVWFATNASSVSDRELEPLRDRVASEADLGEMAPKVTMPPEPSVAANAPELAAEKSAMAPPAIPPAETSAPAPVAMPGSELEAKVLELGRGLSGADLLRARVAFKEATAESLSADPKYNPWRATLDEAGRASLQTLLESTNQRLKDLRMERLSLEARLVRGLHKAGQSEQESAGASGEKNSPDEVVISQRNPDGTKAFVRLSPGLSAERDQHEMAESLLMIEAEKQVISIFHAASRAGR